MSASHLPTQQTDFIPRLCSFSVTDAASLFDAVDDAVALGTTPLLLLDRPPCSVVFEEGLGGRGEFAPLVEVPGCLKMPKLIDFLCD